MSRLDDPVIVTQEDIDAGDEFYCLCHGWRRLESAEELCPYTYSQMGRASGS